MANGTDVYGRCVNACGRIASHCLQCDPMALPVGWVGMTYKQSTPDDHTLARRIKRGVYAYFDAELHKRCVKCKEYWPADTEFFYDSKAHNDGISDTCRACSCEQRQYYRTPSENRMAAA